MKILKIKVYFFIISLIGLLFIFLPGFIQPSSVFFSKQTEKWAHKGCGKYNAYNIENFVYAKKQKFKGIELDLVYKNNELWVQHDTASLNNPLLFNDLLPVLNDLGLKYWIDLKYGFESSSAIPELIKAFDQHPLVKQNSIIETGSFKSLYLLNKNNFKITYRIRIFTGSIINKIISLIKNNLYIIIFQPESISLSSSAINKWVDLLYKRQNKTIWITKPTGITRQQLKVNKIKVLLVDCAKKYQYFE